MTLTTGIRLSRDARSAFEIVEGGWTGARHSYHRARKVFWNFRYPAEVLDEASADEWLDVLVRVPLTEAAAGHDFAFEWDAVFARQGAPWFLEPLDLLDPPDAGSPGTVRAPLLVLADPHADQLPAGPPPDQESARRLARILSEVPAMFDRLHHQGLVTGALETDDFLVDPTGRWFYLGTDRITAGSDMAARADRDHWSRLVARVLTGSDRIEDLDTRPWAEDARQILAGWKGMA